MSTIDSKVFSGEPLPLAPPPENPERGAFDRKLLDYLRRLTAKLAQVTNGGTVEADLKTFASSLSEDKDEIGVGDFYIPWDYDLHVDADTYSHSETVDNASITVLKDGLYVVMVDVSTAIFAAPLRLEVVLGIGAGSYNLNFGNSNYVVPTNSENQSMVVAIPLIAGTTIRIRLFCFLDPDSGIVNQSGTRVTIIRVKTTADGGQGGGGWDGNGGTSGSIPPWGFPIKEH